MQTFEELWKEHSRSFYAGVLRHMRSDNPQFDDAVQEARIAVWGLRSKLTGIAARDTMFIRQAAAYEALKMTGSQAHHHPTGHIKASYAEPRLNYVDPTSDVWNVGVDVDLRERDEKDYSELHSAIAKLSETHRTAIQLQYFEGLGPKEVAQEMGISRVAANSRRSRAVKKLQEILGAE